MMVDQGLICLEAAVALRLWTRFRTNLHVPPRPGPRSPCRDRPRSKLLSEIMYKPRMTAYLPPALTSRSCQPPTFPLRNGSLVQFQLARVSLCLGGNLVALEHFSTGK